MLIPINKQKGEVYIVGAGPGDAELLTLKALRLLQQSDIILYDQRVSQEILDMANDTAEKIYVGKVSGNHSIPQGDISKLLASLAKQGKKVCRLKGGDPFVFGRGGEELEELAKQNIKYQVVPGITAAVGCAAYAGIPLTHRDYAQSVTFATAHSKAGDEQVDWQQLVKPNHTLVLYMGLKQLETVAQQLMKHGLPVDYPIAIVEKGTMKDQRVIVATLGALPAKHQLDQVQSPTLLIVGEVVKLHEQLDWFQSNSDYGSSIKAIAK